MSSLYRCPVCLGLFRPDEPGEIYCSDPCRRTAWGREGKPSSTACADCAAPVEQPTRGRLVLRCPSCRVQARRRCSRESARRRRASVADKEPEPVARVIECPTCRRTFTTDVPDEDVLLAAVQDPRKTTTGKSATTRCTAATTHG